MRSILLVVILMLSLGSSSLFAQNFNTIDSLYQQLGAASPTEKAKLYNDIGWEYRLSYPDSTIYYSQKVIQANQDSSESLRAMNFMGIAYQYKGNHAKAFEIFRKALDGARSGTDSIQLAHTYNNLGRVYFNQGETIRSYDYFVEALAIFEKLDNQKGIGYCYQSLTQLYLLQQKDEEALDMLLKSLEIRRETKNFRGQISTLQDLALFYVNKQGYEEAVQYLQEARQIGELIDDKISLAEINLTLAKLHLDQKDFKEALSYSNKALVTAGVSNNKEILSTIYLTLAKVHYAKNELTKARIFFKKVEQITQINENLVDRKDAFYYLSKIYERSGDTQRALSYFHQFVETRDSLHNIENALAIERLENRLSIEQKEKEYELLKTNEARQRATIKQQKIRNIAMLAILILFVLLFFLLLVFNRRIKLKNKLLTEQKNFIQNQKKKILSQNADLMQNNERLAELYQEQETIMNIMSHDLKAPFHRITALSDMLSNSSPEERELYSHLIKESAEEGNTLIRDLLDASSIENNDKPKFSLLELLPLLEDCVEKFESTAESKNITLHRSSEDNLSLYTEEVYLCRILENLVSNAIKYSKQGTNVWIKAFEDKTHGQICISIKDEGPGFTDEDKLFLYQKFRKLSAQPTKGESSHGLGLAIVKTLVSRLEGHIELITGPKQGSEFIISFPVHQKQPVS